MECWSLSTIGQLPDASVALLDSGAHPRIYPLPGCLIIPTDFGIYILDPVTLTPIPCKMLQAQDSNSHSEDDGTPRPQFDIADCSLKILSVFDINWSSSKDKQNTDNNTAGSSCSATVVTNINVVNNQSDCSCVAMAINYRLIVMKITRRYVKHYSDRLYQV